jgi:hypothetical protein
MANEFTGAATQLSVNDIEHAAETLRCHRAVIDAVCEVESGGSAFLPDGRPKILFEAHVFGRLTGGRWNRSHPNISAPVWDRSLYGRAGAHQYDRLDEAKELDRFAALQSASWGRFQILGENYRLVGYDDVEDFVKAMCDSEAKQLEAFLAFCEARHLNAALRGQDWETFALRYNGSGQVAHYAGALQSAFARHSAGISTSGQPVLHLSARGPAVQELQKRLVKAGCELKPDGIFGQATLAAVRQFQADHGLVPDGVVGAGTWDALNKTN